MDSTAIFEPEYKPYREALGAFEALRRLGFRPEDIFFVVGPLPNALDAIIQLRTQQRIFSYGCGQLRKDETWAHKTWQETAKYWNKIGKEEQDKVYYSSLAAARGLHFVLLLTQRGFVIPREPKGHPHAFWN